MGKTAAVVEVMAVGLALLVGVSKGAAAMVAVAAEEVAMGVGVLAAAALERGAAAVVRVAVWQAVEAACEARSLASPVKEVASQA